VSDVVVLDGDRHESALCEKRGQFQEVCGCGWRSSWTTDQAAATEHEVHVAAEKLWARLTEPQQRTLDALMAVDGWFTGRTQQESTSGTRGNGYKVVVNAGAARRLVDNGYALSEWVGAYRFCVSQRGRDIHPLSRCSARYGGKTCGYCHACRRRLPQPESLACPHCGATDWDE
jgi:hypothetical protein